MLHLAVSDIRADADQARLLGSLSAAKLLQGCTPVVNLFRQPGVPVSVDQRSADYTVLAHGSHPQAFEVYSVDRVHMVHQVGRAAQPDEFRPFYSLRHAEDDGRPARYWLMRHDETLAVCGPGHEKTLSLVDDDCEAFEVDRSVLSIDLSCTNRDLPCSLRLGAREGDLFAPGAAGEHTIRFLRRPTRPARLVNGADTQWRLVSHLALNHHSLVQDSAALREMLGLYDLARSPVTRRQIGGIAAVEAVDSTAWIRHRRGSSLSRIAPGLYAKGEDFDQPQYPNGMGTREIPGLVWQRVLTVRNNGGAVAPRTALRLSREVARPTPHMDCNSHQTCPVTGTWQPWLPPGHPYEQSVNQAWRQRWLTAGQPFPDPKRDWMLPLADGELKWHLLESEASAKAAER